MDTRPALADSPCPRSPSCVDRSGAGARLVRFWLSSDGYLRVEWSVGGRLDFAIGRPGAWDVEPPDEVEDEITDEGDPRCVALVPDLDALWKIHEASCLTCGTQQASPDELSRDGECGRCFVAAMAHEPITVAIPKQSLAECAAEWRRQMADQGLVRSTAAVDEVFEATRKQIADEIGERCDDATRALLAEVL